MRRDDKVSLIIPCYWANQELIDSTERCLASLDDPYLQLIIVDDGSPLRHKPSKFDEFIVSNKNLGYARAVNRGLDAANGKYIIICNNDIEFIQTDWLTHLLTPLENGYDISSIRTTDSDGWLTEDRLEENAKFGSIWAMKREVYDTIGELDTGFGKGYFEDLDYHKRAEDAGFKVVKNHAGLVQHQGKATFSDIDPDDKQYVSAMKLFRKKWGRVW
jgi:GT2 family glycosyltransferase